MRRLPKLLIVVIVIIGIIVIGKYIIRQSSWYKREVYPLEYEEYIKKYSKEYSLDPYLVSAVIWTESRFNPKAKSHKSAMGLMQITPQTGTWAADVLKLEGFKVEDLYDVELNIRLGCWYLDRLRSQFGGDMDVALAAYNGGSGNVSKWLKDNRYSRDGKKLDHIPFQETREYVLKVNAVYEQYKNLYDL